MQYNLCKPVCIWSSKYTFTLHCIEFSPTLHIFSSLDWQHRTTCIHAFAHKQTLVVYWKCSVNPGSALASHMTEVECEISTQTFMRADLHYITSVPHHGCREWEQGKMGKKQTNYTSIGGRSRRERTKEIEKGGSRGSSGWGHTRVSLRRCLFLLARHDFTTASLFADMTSLMQTEPMPSSISKKTPNTFMQVAPLLCGNLQQSYKLFLGFDKSCSVYYYTWYRGETQIPQKCCGWSGTA